MKYNELERVLKEMGWKHDRTRGSHHVFVHPDTCQTISIAVHGKDIPRVTVAKIMKNIERVLAEKRRDQ